jgi:hypothetical protein
MTARILELEHATIRPLGEFPDHCPRCRRVAETWALQETCDHPAESRQEIDITEFGSPRPMTLTNCLLCGKGLGQS